MSDTALRVDDLIVTLPRAARRVVDSVSFTIAAGECLGLVGESGSGKSVTARAVLGTPPEGMKTGGRLEVNGRVIDLHNAEAMRRWRASEVGVIFQDPSAIMDPTRPIGDFLTEVLVFERGVSRPDARRRAADMLASMGLRETEAMLSRYPHEFSGGQLQRICIAAALLPEPKLLIADEPTTALDNSSQAVVISLLEEARRERGLSMLFITHNLELALAFCDRIAVAYAGRVVELETSDVIASGGHHPYTDALLRCRPDVTRRRPELPAIAGQPPTLAVPLSGCVFHARCPRAVDECASVPAWTDTGDTTGFACIRPVDRAPEPTGADRVA
jgi:peptide/nickel transport system ATP-binding protein